MSRETGQPPPGPYPWIRAWGWMMGSHKYYIDAQIERAQKTGAPPDAIYEHHDAGKGGNGTWARASEIHNPGTRYALELQFGPLPGEEKP